MDPLILKELDALDPAVPFRASTRHQHHTWAKTFHSRPELYIRPRSTAEIEKVVTLARRCRRRLTTVGCAHSPSDLTCTSSWIVNLDDFKDVLAADRNSGVVVMQSGIRLHQLRDKLRELGLAMANLGSIDSQSIAGAIATGTHGSSLRHGLLSESVLALRIMLANGRTVQCSRDQNHALFRAALVSLGALGIVTEVTFKAVPSFDIEWRQTLQPLDRVLAAWDRDLWSQAEFVRVWWIPYAKRAVVWKAEKTRKARRPARVGWHSRLIGYHTYQTLLYLARWMPPLLPAIEWLVFGMQYGFRDGSTTSAVEEGHAGLSMDCLYSQFVNEWAIPLDRGPEAIGRLSAWIHGDQEGSGIPISCDGVYVHAPVEVRVTDSSGASPRPNLDNTSDSGPTLLLNATLYRPFHADPPAHERYYAAFEHLMKELGGRPHWAKNFLTVTHDDIARMYGDELVDWVRVRNAVDPEGMFVGDWHRRYLLGGDRALEGLGDGTSASTTTPTTPTSPAAAAAAAAARTSRTCNYFPLEEREASRSTNRKEGGVLVVGEPATPRTRTRSRTRSSETTSSASGESFHLLHPEETEKSTLFVGPSSSVPAMQEGEGGLRE